MKNTINTTITNIFANDIREIDSLVSSHMTAFAAACGLDDEEGEIRA